MVHNKVDLDVPGVSESFETFEGGGTVLYVVHDLQSGDAEGLYALRQRLNPLLAPDGRYATYRLKAKDDPSADWA
jgi:hypothetical protein